MGRPLAFGRAENEALRQEMERDERVFVMGEDVAGGAGRAAQGIIDAWGDPTGATKGSGSSKATNSIPTRHKRRA